MLNTCSSPTISSTPCPQISRPIKPWLCALGPSFTAMERMQLSSADTIVVPGCGAVGLGAIVNARTIGARVIALEL